MSESASKATRRIAVLVSGSGSNLQALIDASEQQKLPGVEIALVVSNKANAVGLQRALTHRIPTVYLPWSWTRQEVEAKLAAIFQLFQIDLIVLAGWMRIFTPKFIAQYPNHIINLHPALLPDDGQGDTFTTRNGSVVPVLRGLHVVERALEAGIKVTGSTVHYVTPEVDAGPMICRTEVPIQDSDTEETLHTRIKQLEHTLIVQAVQLLTQNE
ncbi:MAG: phosphoribosylglycinamide formyltransferase [Ktedonobacteraceae bacterium]